MQPLKIAIATAALAATTIGGAYASGVVNKFGHPVDDHAAHGQAVAAGARATHLAKSAHGRPHRTAKAGRGDAATLARPAPGAAPAKGKRLGLKKAHRHAGHQWGRGHGTGKPTRPAPTPPARPAHPIRIAPPSHLIHPHPVTPMHEADGSTVPTVA